MEKQYYGYVGKTLRVDLNNGKFNVEPTEKYIDWLGGSGVGQWIIFNEVMPWVSPYDPANILVIGTGPLSGTLAPTSSRVAADSKSPVTMGVGSSNAGGYIAAEIKYAGFDHIVLKGKSSKPVYLWINDGKFQLKDASHLWGKTTGETDDLIRNELGDPKVQTLCIGPAGENLVRASCIIVNKVRALGRCGMGTVMGSKNLKAIAVRGTGKVNVAHPERFMNIVDQILESYTKSSGTARHMKYGTLGLIPSKNKTSGIPYKNFQDLTIPTEMMETFDPDKLHDEYDRTPWSCFACPMSCGSYTYTRKGPNAGLKAFRTQYEAFADYGGKIAINDYSYVLKANDLCNQYGIDYDLPGETIAWAMECFERGLLSEKDFDGLKPTFGDGGVVLELIRKIAYREGIGDILAEGVARASDIMGKDTKYYAMHIKGQDLYEVLRSSVGWGFAVCVSTRGGGHTTGAPSCEINPFIDKEKAKKLYGIDTFNQPLKFEGKEKLVMYYEMLHRVNNSLGLCHSGTDWKDIMHPGFPEIAELYSATTGIEVSADDLKRASLRMLNVEKAFNILHAGFDRKDDYPPLRMMNEPIKSGDAKGFKLDKENFDTLLDKYYELHQWDKKTSFPTRKCLEDLGLETVANKLEDAGKLGNGEIPIPQ